MNQKHCPLLLTFLLLEGCALSTLAANGFAVRNLIAAAAAADLNEYIALTWAGGDAVLVA